jgi:hypothetical protein
MVVMTFPPVPEVGTEHQHQQYQDWRQDRTTGEQAG